MAHYSPMNHKPFLRLYITSQWQMWVDCIWTKCELYEPLVTQISENIMAASVRVLNNLGGRHGLSCKNRRSIASQSIRSSGDLNVTSIPTVQWWSQQHSSWDGDQVGETRYPDIPWHQIPAWINTSLATNSPHHHIHSSSIEMFQYSQHNQPNWGNFQ